MREARDQAGGATVKAALGAIGAGSIIVVRATPDERVGEGALVMAAEHCTAEAIAFMAREARGIVSIALTEERCDALGLRLLEGRDDRALRGGAYTVSIEAREGVSTGISAADRAHTVVTAADPAAGAHDIVSPGHVMPLRARAGGVLARPRHTEAAVDLARLAGCEPAGVVCMVLDDQGAIARPDDLDALAAREGLPVLAVEDLVAHRRATEQWLEPAGERELAAAGGALRAVAVADRYRGDAMVALVLGRREAAGGPAFVEHVCFAGPLFGATDCGCGARVAARLEAIRDAGRGVLVCIPPADALDLVAGRCDVPGGGRERDAAVRSNVIELLRSGII